MERLGALAQMSLTEIIPTFGEVKMSGSQRREGRAAMEIAQIREALGAVAAAAPAVFWIYRRQDGKWAARREGAVSERVFDSREAAESDVALLATRCRSYRLFVEQESGKFAEENAGWPAAVRRLIADND
jgi:hypothetical protein